MNINKTKNKNIKKWLWAYLFISPTVIGVCILCIWPIIQSFYYSFNEIKQFGTPKFVGLNNYIHLFQDPEVANSLGNTFMYVILTVPIGILLSLICAVLLNSKIKFKSFFRCLYFLPVVSTPAAVALVWKWLFAGKFGLINQMLGKVGIQGPDWLSSPHWVLIAVSIVGIWSSVGYNMIILLAGLQNIPKELYEAAEIDGAGPFGKFRFITIPLVSPTTFFVMITSIISALQVFDTIYMMVKPTSPSFSKVESIVYLFYRDTFQFYNKGYGSTIAAVLFIIIMAITIIQMKLQKRWVVYD
jgi:multiple sugar transport system permease protein